MLDAVVIGSGPNGLSAAIVLARAGLSVAVYEAQPTIGGGMRTAELTLPGFHHDICSAVHPLAFASPFFEELRLERYGLQWIHPPAALAHPLDGEPPALLQTSFEATARGLGRDAASYCRLYEPLLSRWPALRGEILGPVRWPRHPFALARFGARALLPATVLARTLFQTARARALFAGICAHSVLPLNAIASSAVGLVLSLAGHTGGWPLPRGGSQAIARALAACLEAHGGKIVTSFPVEDLTQLPPARAVIFDLTPRQIVKIARHRLSDAFRRRLERYRYGPGVFKIDWALREPIPWRAPECATAATVHLGGTLEEMAVSENACWHGTYAEQPYVLLVQPSLFDPTRAPEGRHTAWAYCHVPNGSPNNRTEAIEQQIERFAPGFRDVILARHVMGPADLEARNANLVGGDIGGGACTLGQLFLRPTRGLYATSDPALWIGSSSTPPGPGVHGMCGYHAAQRVLRHLR
ncbi:MAG: NAD(P)/FAD-dependent oxidoreductase [Verrucomicrobiota bacterium]